MLLSSIFLYCSDGPSYIVRLGSSQSPRPRAWFGPMENTKLGLHTHPPPPPSITQTCLPLPGYTGISESVYNLNFSIRKYFYEESPPIPKSLVKSEGF